MLKRGLLRFARNDERYFMISSPSDIVTFWRDAGYDRWYGKDDAFDQELRDRFMDTWEAARDGKLTAWQDSDEGALALLIVLDQFPRNMFRNDARAFSTDALARSVAARAIAEGRDQRIEQGMRSFMYLPFEHSEDMADQEHSIALFEPLGADSLKWAVLHADIIRKFGRFPHRNAVLGRTTTPEEAAFLAEGGFKG
ncbi:putative transmembrane protein [Bradyrhizobiaceae bacterium SG-6C]|nr:putative transmembrane protein [Bradyrhizobiaceae bacterium SG-6C]